MADVGGVDASIPLRAGQGIGAPLNPLEQIGKFAQVSNLINTGQIQQQTIQANKMSLAQQQKQLAYAHIAPLVAQGRINSMADLTSAAGALEHYGINTQPFLADVARTVSQDGNFIDNLKMQTVAGMQPPESVGKAIFPGQESVDQGLVSQPFLRGAPGTPGEGVRTAAGPATPLGMSPGQQGSPVTWTDKTGATQHGTIRQYNEALGNGLVNGPAVPAPSAVPAFGNPGGRYHPDNPALRNPNAAPATAAPASGAPASAAPVPPPAQRQAGKTYPTPRGPMTWTGTGWLPAGGQ